MSILSNKLRNSNNSEWAEKEIERLQSELDRYKNGYQGACYACEPVAKENERLKNRVPVVLCSDCNELQDENERLRAENARLEEYYGETESIDEMKCEIERLRKVAQIEWDEWTEVLKELDQQTEIAEGYRKDVRVLRAALEKILFCPKPGEEPLRKIAREALRDE